MKDQYDLTCERLREILSYDPDTGIFTWKVAVSKVKAGAVAGCNDGQGYLRIKIDGRNYKSHRLAWLYMTGEWPKEQVDHVNGSRGDNRFENLREAAHAENLWNSGKRVDNTSGFKGVFFDTQARKWRALIGIKGKQKSLGRFTSPEAAHAAYVAAAKKYFGEFARAD